MGGSIDRLARAMDLLRQATCPNPNCDKKGTELIGIHQQAEAVCCGTPLETGECCGSPVQGHAGDEPEFGPCTWCTERARLLDEPVELTVEQQQEVWDSALDPDELPF